MPTLQAALEATVTYRFLRRYREAADEARHGIGIAPDQIGAVYQGALNYVLWDGATDNARSLLESAPSMESPRIDYMSYLLDLYDRRPESVMARLREASIEAYSFQDWYIPRGLLECSCLSEMDEKQAAEAACVSAVELLEREIVARPHDHRLHSALGHTFALLERSEEAVRAGEKAVELMPIVKDALAGSDQAIELAKIYTRVGRFGNAMDLIEELLSIPCNLSVGLLSLDPVWDPLRDHPRFQALFEEYDTAN